MIDTMHIENFKCFRKFEIELGQFNILIGPNDSGKTAFLQAVGIASHIGCQAYGIECRYQPVPLKCFWPEYVWQQDSNQKIEITFSASLSGNDFRRFPVVLDPKQFKEFRLVDSPTDTAANWFQKAVGVVEYYKLDPAAMKEASEEKAEFKSDGRGLPTFLSDLLRKDRQAFGVMEAEFMKRFPQYRIELPRVGVSTNNLVFSARDGMVLSASNVSDGAVLYLAFLALNHRHNPPRILLIEEPENGVHHAALKKIVEVLKAICDEKNVQLIVTTHSPYLLDYVEPDQVHVFSKDETGAVTARKLSSFEDAEEMKKHFMTGEIWSSLAEREHI